MVCVSAIDKSGELWSVFQQLLIQQTLVCVSATDSSGKLWSAFQQLMIQENCGLFRRTLVCVSAVDNSGELWSVFRQLTIQENFVFQQLTIQENSPGKDGMEYKLSCKVSCPLLPRNHSIPSYDIPFLFYNGELSELA